MTAKLEKAMNSSLAGPGHEWGQTGPSIEGMFERMADEPDRFTEIGAEHGVTFPDVDQ